MYILQYYTALLPVLWMQYRNHRNRTFLSIASMFLIFSQVHAEIFLWSSNYLDQRIAELKHETICQQWDKASLNQELSKIHVRQKDKEKHT